MHLILTGATGTCGATVLKYCLADSAATRLTILSHRAVAQAEGFCKVTVFIHNDFPLYPQQLLDQLKGAEGGIWALGVSQDDVNKEEYVKITYNYPIAAAKVFASLSTLFKFVFVSGEGADPTGRSKVLFARTKGRADKDLYALTNSPKTSSLRVFPARPGMIDPEGEHLGSAPPALSYKTLLAPVMQRCAPNYIIGTQPLARALILLALSDGEKIPEDEGIEVQGRTLRTLN